MQESKMRKQAGEASWEVKVGEETTSAIFEPAERPGRGGLYVFAHGAGGHLGDRGMAAMAEVFRGMGLSVIRFNFLYRERRSSRPDAMPRLMECFSAVVARAREEIGPEHLLLGGRSMGGRAASMLAAEGFACDGLILLAYPLHPAGRPEKLRDAHLPKIRAPVICFNGTRDSLCRRDLMEKAVAGLGGWRQHWIEGADHGLHVLKSSGRSDEEVRREIGETGGRWVAEVLVSR